MLDDAEADAFGDRYYCAITPKQKYELLRDPEVTSSDFGSSGSVSLGQLGEFMGIDFRVLSSSRIPFLSGVLRRCFVWSKQSMLYVRSTKGVRGYADRLPTKNQSTQIQVKGDHASTRLWEDAIVDVICDEA